jgi:GAF domain-containing protein/histidine kinase/DNA gyrase B/HSP90-like ATPase
MKPGTLEGHDRRMRFVLALSRAVYRSAGTANTLDRVAEEVCRIADADAAGILELTDDGTLRIVGGYQLAAGYRRSMHHWPVPVRWGQGPSGLAVASAKAVVSEDFRRDFPQWAAMPWGGIAAFPLTADSGPLGTLVVYRENKGRWEADVISLLELASEHATVAIQTAKLLAEQKRELAALRRQLAGLREQSHEHANQLHALAGLLVLDQPEEARQLLRDLTDIDLTDRPVLGGDRPAGVLTALLHVETLVARHRGITLEVQRPRTLRPTLLTDAQTIVILGNLVDNACEALNQVPPGRRRIRVNITQTATHMVIAVRDWGPGLPPGTDWFQRGASTRPGHRGLGLALTFDAVTSAYGEITSVPHDEGVTFEVRVPLKTLRSPKAVAR